MLQTATDGNGLNLLKHTIEQFGVSSECESLLCCLPTSTLAEEDAEFSQSSWICWRCLPPRTRPLPPDSGALPSLSFLTLFRSSVSRSEEWRGACLIRCIWVSRPRLRRLPLPQHGHNGGYGENGYPIIIGFFQIGLVTLVSSKQNSKRCL